MAPGTTTSTEDSKKAAKKDASKKAPPAVTKQAAKTTTTTQGSSLPGPRLGAPYAAVPGPGGVNGPFMMQHPTIIAPYYNTYNIPLGPPPPPGAGPPPVTGIQGLNNNNNKNNNNDDKVETTTVDAATTKIRLDHFNNAIMNMTADMKRLQSVVSKLEGKVNTLEQQLQQTNARNEELSILLQRNEAKLLYYETATERAEGQESLASSSSSSYSAAAAAAAAAAQQTTTTMVTQKTTPRNEHGSKSNDKIVAAKAKSTINKTKTKQKKNHPFQKTTKSSPVQSLHDANWEKNFAKLQEYREHAGHCNYSTKNTDDLATFVSTVRRHYRELKQGRLVESLTRERIQRLNALGFEWERVKKNRAAPLPFEERIKQLVEYKAQHGNCNVRPNDPNVPLPLLFSS